MGEWANVWHYYAPDNAALHLQALPFAQLLRSSVCHFALA